MSVPWTTADAALPTTDAAIPAGIALAPDHPLVVAAWLAAGLVIAAGLGPWVARALGVALPAFAVVRTKG